MASPITSRAPSFKSAYGPKYQHQANIHGWNKTAVTRIWRGADHSDEDHKLTVGNRCLRAGMYGGAAGVAALLFVSGIPRVRTDIMERIPFVGHFFVKEPVNPADNVSFR
ncbi:hypothetical protein CP532_2705 [Ophiocordyceps camponoti-leonardi (nom. inval.)]|nr:hypothetical protein CP532_2705 [Ophiocordyceps camponoti-leonardi (nom. inval.)]